MSNLGGRGCTCRVIMCELYTVDQYNEGSDGQMVSKSYGRHIRIAPKSTRASVASNSITSGRGRRKEKEIFTAKNASWIRRRCRCTGEDADAQEKRTPPGIVMSI